MRLSLRRPVKMSPIQFLVVWEVELFAVLQGFIMSKDTRLLFSVSVEVH